MRILVAGDVEGNFKQLFTRVQTIVKKNGPFELLLCVGAFFSGEAECQQQWKAFTESLQQQQQEGSKLVPMPTFILGPCSPDHEAFFEDLSSDGGELCSDITCLGQRGLYTTSSGLQIAYVSGVHDHRMYNRTQSGSGDKMRHFMSESDISSMVSMTERDGFRGVDLLLTSEWPKGVENFTTTPDGLDVSRVGAEPVSTLAMALKPRYHFTAGQKVFFERTPYRNHDVLQGSQSHVTRFISLAQVGNTDKKQRYLYAFSIHPLSSMDAQELTQQPASITNCPYTSVVRSKPAPAQQNFFFDPKALAAGMKRKQREQQGLMGGPLSKRPPPSRPPIPQGPCWFCLGGAEVEKHLVVAVGDHTYLALPKGGLVENHVLVLPIGHYPASTDAPQEVLEELARFRASLRRYFASQEQCCVIFERNFRSQHLQLQVVPLPAMPSDALRQAFLDHARGLGIQLSEVARDAPLSELVQVGAPYFIVEFDDGPSLYTRIKGRFPLQFGREVLASPLVLGVPQRVDWKACSTSKQEEAAATKSFRQNYQPFDFTDDS